MLRPFRLKRPLGLAYTMDEDDVLKTKQALHSLGLYDSPKRYGLTRYPDMPLIDGIKAFQRRSGLREDGVAKPGGPTITALGRALDERTPQRRRSIVEGEWDRRRRSDRRRDPIPQGVFTTVARPSPRPATFGIGAGIGAGRANRPRDLLALKRALAWAGHLPGDKAVAANRPDDGLFEAVRAFQRAAGVKPDGWLRPGGETERALDKAIAPKVRAHRGDSAETGTRTDGGKTQLAMARKPRPGGGSGFTEGAMENPLGLGGAAAAVGTGIAAQELIRQQMRRQGHQVDETPTPPEPGAARPRTDIAPPSPPTPPSEPPRDEDRPPTKTEFPATPVELPDLSRPIPDVEKPTIFIHPSLEPGEFDSTILESKGNPRTKKHLDSVRDDILDANPGWRHIAGGRDRKTGAEMTEYYIAGPAHAFPLPGRKTGDGRAGSIRTDMTFVSPDGKTFIHVQTVDVDRNGKPKQHELDNALRGYRGLEARRQEGEVHHIVLIGKDWMMPK